MPNANGCMPSCSTRYIGSTLAIISDEMSVNRLVTPSAQTVVLTAGSSREDDDAGRHWARGQVAHAEQLRCVRVRRPVQSMASMRNLRCHTGDRKRSATVEAAKSLRERGTGRESLPRRRL